MTQIESHTTSYGSLLFFLFCLTYVPLQAVPTRLNFFSLLLGDTMSCLNGCFIGINTAISVTNSATEAIEQGVSLRWLLARSTASVAEGSVASVKSGAAAPR